MEIAVDIFYKIKYIFAKTIDKLKIYDIIYLKVKVSQTFRSEYG